MLINASIAGRANELLTQTLLGVPLRMSRLHAVSTGAADVATWLVIGWAVLVIAAAVVAVFVPVAAGLYLLTTVTWTSGQPVAIRRVQRRDKELALL